MSHRGALLGSRVDARLSLRLSLDTGSQRVVSAGLPSNHAPHGVPQTVLFIIAKNSTRPHVAVNNHYNIRIICGE